MNAAHQEPQGSAELSRDARSLAFTQAIYAGMGEATITFQRPEKIHPRAKAAFDELVAGGWFEEKHDTRGAVTYRAVKPKIFDATSFGEPDRADSFPLRLPDDEQAQTETEATTTRWRPRA